MVPRTCSLRRGPLILPPLLYGSVFGSHLFFVPTPVEAYGVWEEIPVHDSSRVGAVNGKRFTGREKY